MFDSDKLENKAMSNKFIFVKNNSKSVIHGLLPDVSVKIRLDCNGLPADPYWRKMYRRPETNKILKFYSQDKKQSKSADEAEAKPGKSKSTKKGD